MAYIGAKFGSATITSWPRLSRCCATHSLSVEASTRMRAGVLPANTSSKLALVDLMRRSVSSPPSLRAQIWLEVLCRSMPTKSMAGHLCAISTACSKSRALCRSAAASRFIPFNYVYSNLPTKRYRILEWASEKRITAEADCSSNLPQNIEQIISYDYHPIESCTQGWVSLSHKATHSSSSY